MRIPHGDVSRCVYFKAVDSTDFVTPETGLTSFTVAYSIDGGEDVAMTTPTTTEIDATAMPGIYALDIDESGMVTLPIGAIEVEVALHVTKTGMAPVDRVYTVAAGNIASQVNDASATTTSFVTDLSSSVDNFYNGMYCKITSGSLAGQVRKVTDYTGSTKTLSFTDAYTSAPADDVTFILINQ